MDDFESFEKTGYPVPEKRRKNTGIALIIIVTILLFVLAFAGFTALSLYKQSKGAEENIVINIPEDIVRAVDPVFLQTGDPYAWAGKNTKVIYSALLDTSKGEGTYSYSLTESAFDGIDALNIDMRRNNDLSALRYLKNLHSLVINNADLMKDEDIAVLNELNLTHIEFVIDSVNIRFWDPGLPDYTLCSCADKTITLLNNDYHDENETYALYHVFSRFYPSVVCTGMDYDKYKQVDDKLAQIISRVDLTNCENEKQLVLKYIIAAVKYLYYDDVVSDYSQVNDTLDPNSEVYKLCEYYNDYQLTSTLLNGKDTGTGCCTNFTSLYLAICVKMDQEAYMVDGQRSADSGFLHDWNYVEADGDYYCFDITETNRWFKRSAGMYRSYFYELIDGDTDIFDDTYFYDSFYRQIFETYNNFIWDTYVFFDDVNTLIKVADDSREVTLFNESAVPVTRRYININDAVTSGAFGAAACALPVLCVMIIIKIRRSKKHG